MIAQQLIEDIIVVAFQEHTDKRVYYHTALRMQIRNGH